MDEAAVAAHRDHLTVRVVPVAAERADEVRRLLEPGSPVEVLTAPLAPGCDENGVIVLVADRLSDVCDELLDALLDGAVPWVLHTAEPDVAQSVAVLQEGGAGCVCTRDPLELLGCLRRAHTGRFAVDQAIALELLRDAARRSDPIVDRWALRPREREILDLLLTGRNNRQIANELYLTEHTVKSHLRTLYRKLGARNRAEAIAIASGRR